MFLRIVHLVALLGIIFGAGVTSGEGAISMRPSEHRGIERVREYLAQAQYAEAIDVLEPLLERDTHHPLVDFYRGLIAQSRQDYAAAVPWFERSVAGGPTLHAGWINLAQCRFQIQDYAAAAQAFTRSYALSDPSEPLWRYNAALAWYQAGELVRARELMLQLLEDFPTAVELQWRELLVHIYLHREGEQNHRLALAHVEILAQQSSAAAQRRWREYLIHLYLQLDMREKAEEFVAHLLEVEILEPRWWRIAAHLHLEAQRYADALVALQMVGFLAPGDMREERLRADLCMQLGIPVQAIPYFTNLLENDVAEVQETKALLGLAQAYVQRHKPQEALRYLAQIDTTQESVPQLRLRAQILYMRKDYVQAHAAYAALARREQQPRNSARAWLLAGYAAWNAGELDAAQAALTHAEQEPEFSSQTKQLRRHLPESGRTE
jgi:predicted Zn-dependent protease